MRTLALALLCAAALAGCATRSPAPLPGRDGPPDNPPADLHRVPDAEPRVEPLRFGGPNKPYEVAGRRHVPMTQDLPLSERGGASWYGRKFHGRPTASGEPYDMFAMTAAHRTMPIPSYARVRNPANGREVIVRVNDRGPFVEGRVIDLSYAAALRLGLLNGVAPVEVHRLTHDEIRAGRWARAAPPAQDDPAPGEPPASAAGLWVQLGAFRQREGALALQQRALREWPGAGVAVFDDGGLFRVQLGPLAAREDAAPWLERARRELGVGAALVQRGR